MIEICNLVIVGGKGDLALRKLYPALYSLHNVGLLAKGTKNIGFCCGNYSDNAFINFIGACEWLDGIGDGW